MQAKKRAFPGSFSVALWVGERGPIGPLTHQSKGLEKACSPPDAIKIGQTPHMLFKALAEPVLPGSKLTSQPSLCMLSCFWNPLLPVGLPRASLLSTPGWGDLHSLFCPVQEKPELDSGESSETDFGQGRLQQGNEISVWFCTQLQMQQELLWPRGRVSVSGCEITGNEIQGTLGARGF